MTLDASITDNLGAVLRQTNAYTPNGRQASLKDANSHTTNYAYDGFDRPKQTTYPDGSTEGATYDANNNPLTWVTRAGAVMTMSYDSRNRLSSKAVPANSNAAAVTYGYAYDYSNRTLSVQASTDGAAYAYAYDTAGRQLSETRPDGKEVFHQLDHTGLSWRTDTISTHDVR